MIQFFINPKARDDGGQAPFLADQRTRSVLAIKDRDERATAARP